MTLGNNKLLLNRNTMIQIVQEWADRTYIVAPEVTGFAYLTGGQFEVELVPKKTGAQK